VIYFVDFEASSLSKGSFPVEIAWVDQLGHGESYLIRPPEEWLGDGRNWSFQSERIHGISLPELLTDGYPLSKVAQRAHAVLSPVTSVVVSDAPPFDGYWLEMLLKAGGIDQTPVLLHVHDLYRREFAGIQDTLPPGNEAARNHLAAWAVEVVREAQETATRRSPTLHRALPDAERLRLTWLTVKKAVAKELEERGL
jgi:hypothetical protein